MRACKFLGRLAIIEVENSCTTAKREEGGSGVEEVTVLLL